MDAQNFVERKYRETIAAEGLKTFSVVQEQSDLWIAADVELRAEAVRALAEARCAIKSYACRHPEFLSSLTPLPQAADAPEIVRHMLAAGEAAVVGPMAAVAGATAEWVGRALLAAGAHELAVENGGDIFTAFSRTRTVGIFAGNSPLSMKLGLKISPVRSPLGIATSSGTVGPSLSFGCADAALILADNSALADAAATALGNRVKNPEDISFALDFARKIEGVLGALVIVGEKMGVIGDLELANISRE
jgi:hypothetical protein